MTVRSLRQRFFRDLLDISGPEGDLKREFIQFVLHSEARFQSASLGDAFAAFMLGRDRSFVELGAWEPVQNSETWALETFFGWHGAQVEPNPDLAAKLRSQRKSLVMEAAIVSSLSTLNSVILAIRGGSDTAKLVRRSIGKNSIRVPAVTWSQITVKVPQVAALFIDIEGAEFDILSDVVKYGPLPDLLVVETLFDRDRIYSLAHAAGYVATLEGLSGYNTWFVRSSYLESWAAKFGKV